MNLKQPKTSKLQLLDCHQGFIVGKKPTITVTSKFNCYFPTKKYYTLVLSNISNKNFMSFLPTLNVFDYQHP